jgi:hypothetical protein
MAIKRGRTGVYRHAVTAVGVIGLTIIDVLITKPGVVSWVGLNAENNKQGKCPQKNRLFTQNPNVSYITQDNC